MPESGDIDHIDGLIRCLGALHTNITKKLNKLFDDTDDQGVVITPGLLSDFLNATSSGREGLAPTIRLHRDDLIRYRDKLEDLSHSLTQIDPKGTVNRTPPGESQKRTLSYFEDFEIDQSRVDDALLEINKTLGTKPQSPNTVCKPVSDLKPDTLFLTSSRVEFDS